MRRQALFLASSLLLTLSSCGENTQASTVESLPSFHCLKDVMSYMNEKTNYSFEEKKGKAITNYHFTKNSTSIVVRNDQSKSRGYVKDSGGIYRICYIDDEFKGSEYLLNDDGSKQDALYDGYNRFSLEGVAGDYVSSISESSNEITITNRDYKKTLIQMFGWSSSEYANLDGISAKYDEGNITFTITMNSNAYSFTSFDFGCAKDSLLDSYKDGHLELNDDLKTLKNGLLGNNMTQDIYDFNEDAYVGVCYFNEHYYGVRYQETLLYTTVYVEIEDEVKSEGHVGIAYGITIPSGLVGGLTPVSEDPDIVTYFHYPSMMMLLDYMEALSPVTEQYDESYVKEGNMYVFDNQSLVYDFAYNMSFDQTWDLATYPPIKVEVDIVKGATLAESKVTFLYYFVAGSDIVRYNVPFYNFGTTTHKVAQAIYDAYKI